MRYSDSLDQNFASTLIKREIHLNSSFSIFLKTFHYTYIIILFTHFAHSFVPRTHTDHIRKHRIEPSLSLPGSARHGAVVKSSAYFPENFLVRSPTISARIISRCSLRRFDQWRFSKREKGRGGGRRKKEFNSWTKFRILKREKDIKNSEKSGKLGFNTFVTQKPNLLSHASAIAWKTNFFAIRIWGQINDLSSKWSFLQWSNETIIKLSRLENLKIVVKTGSNKMIFRNCILQYLYSWKKFWNIIQLSTEINIKLIIWDVSMK